MALTAHRSLLRCLGGADGVERVAQVARVDGTGVDDSTRAQGSVVVATNGDYTHSLGGKELHKP